MQFLSLAPFVPSGKDFEKSKNLFLDLGFFIAWEAPGLASFENGPCKFLLQNYDDKAFAENFMLSITIPDATAFYNEAVKLVEKYGIKVSAPQQMPYGKEVNVIDIAGVCWHFIE